MIRSILSAAALLFAVTVTSAGEFNKVLNLGDAAPAWKDLDGTDGKKHSLADLQDKQAVIVVFTCNSCPVAVDYEDRILKLARKYADSKVALVAINVNTIAEDQLPKMKERAAKKKFPFPYLYDPSQKIAKAFGANYTPEFFVLNAERKVVYMGSLDDTSIARDAKVNYVVDAVESVLASKTVSKGETLARGCRIRFNRGE